MVTKLFASFPPQPDVELRQEAYVESWTGVPFVWVSSALGALTRERGRVFCPSVPEVQTELAAQVRRARIRTCGGADLAHNPRGEAKLSVGGELRYLREHVRGAVAAGTVPERIEATTADEWQEPVL